MRCAATAIALQSLLPLASCAEEPPERYNVVLIMADDLGAHELGCYGHPEHATPNIDRLAAEGARFRTAFATPLCTPSRVMVMTGQYGFRTGYWGNDRRYKPRPGSAMADVGAKTTFADLLGAEGYVCGVTGKWRLTGALPELVYDCGFDEYLIWGSREHLPEEVAAFWHPGQLLTSRYWGPALLENGAYTPAPDDVFGPDVFTDWAIDFVRRHRDESFFLYYPMCLIHRPLVETPDPDRPGGRLSPGIASYVRYMDHCVGRIVAAIDELGLAESTVVIFTADNGTQDEGKGTATELGARVPFVARCPGTVAPAVVSDELTDLTDVLPTLLELAGGHLPEGYRCDGRSLVPTLRVPGTPHREWVFSYVDEHRVLRMKRWLWESETGLYYCGTSRDGTGYRYVEDLELPAVRKARENIESVAERLPAPRREDAQVEEPDLRRDDWKDWDAYEEDDE